MWRCSRQPIHFVCDLHAQNRYERHTSCHWQSADIGNHVNLAHVIPFLLWSVNHNRFLLGIWLVILSSCLTQSRGEKQLYQCRFVWFGKIQFPEISMWAEKKLLIHNETKRSFEVNRIMFEQDLCSGRTWINVWFSFFFGFHNRISFHSISPFCIKAEQFVTSCI